MTPSQLSVRQPVLIASIVTLLLTLGIMSLKKLPVDLFPDVTFPTIIVNTIYAGAGPQEIETEISKVLEDQLATISGVQKVSSQNMEGVSVVIAEFALSTNLDYAEQQVRAKISNAMRLLPDDVDAPVVRKVSPSDAPILGVAFRSTLPDGKLYDIAKENISTQFESVNQVGQVDILGGRKREIHIELDRARLNDADLSATSISNSLLNGGRNIPAGKVFDEKLEYTFRTVAQYENINNITNTVMRVGDIYHPTTIANVGRITDSLQDETSRTRFNGEKALLFNIFRQTGANSVKVADDVAAKITKINADLKAQGIPASLKVVTDLSRRIRANVYDVYESIFLGILLTVIVVYFFLGSLKSTLITGFALPNSLLGACIFMSISNFSINIMSLLAMSLVVGLLVDDAIVVRENIFRKLESGMSPKKAAVIGTNEVTLAVIATTLAVLAVFGPIGNLQGIVGQFFKQFGLTVCFAMIISLFDGLLVAPAMSAYLGGGAPLHAEPRTLVGKYNKRLLQRFDQFQSWLEKKYVALLHVCLENPKKTIGLAVGIFFGSLVIARFVPFTFLPPQDNGEFYIQYELPPGASIEATDRVGRDMEKAVRTRKEVEDILTTTGSTNGESQKGSMYIRLVDSKHRSLNTTQMKDALRDVLKSFKQYNVIVTDNPGQQGSRPFNLNIVGQDLQAIIAFSEKVKAALSKNPGVLQVDSSYREGKPEFQVIMDQEQAKPAGVTPALIGTELRTLIEGQKPAIFRENGVDYDVRVRLREDQRDLRTQFPLIKVPNVGNRLVQLSTVAKLREARGPSTILRENRTRYIQISADVTPGGPGLGGLMAQMKMLFEGELKPPPGVTYSFVGEAERFAELMTNMLVSLGLGVMFIYLVLASLYGSFITPFTIMMVIPLAACGAFLGLFITRSSFDLFSMIGCVMLMGLATKNSILLIDFATELQKKGVGLKEALLKAGDSRLRPILMTSFAVIAGMVPVAIGLNEASKQRTSLGIVVIGGTISSTILTLVVIPAVHLYLDRFQNWILKHYHRIFGADETAV
jgi:hydrophobe/amphiphile efflux-1 (HAE1) family protein